MPTYEYECEVSGKHFDRFQSMSDTPLTECPECGGPVSRLIGAGAGVILKGSGFYATDYKSASEKAIPCGRGQTCCGRQAPCDSRPCDD